MILTESGADFHVRAKKILGDMALLESHLSHYADVITGKLKISIDPVHRDDWFPAVMKQFRA